MFHSYIETELGLIKLTYTEDAVCGLSFCEAPFECHRKDESHKDCKIFTDAQRWLSLYLKGLDPGTPPPLQPLGTPFQKKVWEVTRRIPFGELRTYGWISDALPVSDTGNRVSPQAVGTALSKNPILLMIPCHRIVPKTGGTGGFAGGIERKKQLLILEERIDQIGKSRK